MALKDSKSNVNNKRRGAEQKKRGKKKERKSRALFLKKKKSPAAGMVETKMAPKMAKSAGCGSCGTFFVLFCLAPTSPSR